MVNELIVTGSAVRLRPLPTKDSEPLREMAKGEVVTFVSESPDGFWFEIDTSQGRGWAWRQYLASNTAAKLWYPNAVVPNFSQPTKGKYALGYPRGAVIHWIWAPQTGGLEKAKFWAKYAISQNWTFFTVGNDGSIVQAFPLDEWGNHAGDSYWQPIGPSVSSHLVGIEVVCEGWINDVAGGKYRNRVKNEKTGKVSYRDVDAATVRHIKANSANIAAGYYQRFTAAQERSLTDLLLWLKSNNPAVFDLNLVLGHDEVAGPSGLGQHKPLWKGKWRKTDPGGSLPMTMPEYREYLKLRYDPA